MKCNPSRRALFSYSLLMPFSGSLFALSEAGDNVSVEGAGIGNRNRNPGEALGPYRWGVMIHYLGQPQQTSENWNRQVDGFDVNALAQQLGSIKAGHLIITVGQNSGHYLSPNSTYNEIVGVRPSKCSRRDLVFDLAEALRIKGIKLIAYLPSGAPELDEVAVQRLGWRKGPWRNREFQGKWEKVISEWSARWGSMVSGWWFDGCYWPDAMYRFGDRPNFGSFAAAARMGNPHSIVAFNPGVRNPVRPVTGHEDYTAGEVNEPMSVSCPGGSLQGVRWHMLSYLGKGWGNSEMRFATQTVATWSAAQIFRGGSITWEVPADVRGAIKEQFLPQLQAIGHAIFEKYTPSGTAAK